MSHARLEDAFADQITGKTTGALEANEGKKKWTFYFEDGALTSTKSNLKSEQPEAIREAKPKLGASGVAQVAAVRRLSNACKNAAEWQFLEGTRPSSPLPAPAAALLFKTVSTVRTEAELRAMAGSLLEGCPRVCDDLNNLGLPASSLAPLRALDGQVAGEAILDTLADSPEKALAVLWQAWRLGALEVAQAPAREGAASTAAEAAEAPKASPARVLDIASMIATATPESTPTPDRPLFAERAPARPSGELPVVEIPEEPPFDWPVQDPNTPPPESKDGSSHVLGGIPGRASRQGPPKHPLEDTLRQLHQRISEAPDHFAVLDRPWDSEPEAFRRAHLDLARNLHPDRFADASEELQALANEAFDKIRAAWEILGDNDKRAIYIDKVIRGIKTEEELAMEQVENYWAAEADFKRGLAAFNAGRVAQAHEMFKIAVEKVPDELEFRAYYGFTTFQTLRTSNNEAAQEGIEILKDVLDKNKEQERKLDAAWVLLGRCYRETGEDKLARRCFVQALRINAGNADANREMRRLSGGEPGQKKEEKKEKKGFFGGLFGRKKDK